MSGIRKKGGTIPTKKFWEMNAWVSMEPWATFDYFEPRTVGRFYRYPTNRGVGLFLSTDSREEVLLKTNIRFRFLDEEDRNTFRFSIGPRWRVSDQLNFSFNTAVNFFSNDVGFVNKVSKNADEKDIIFGIRDISTVENSLFAACNFTPTMSLTFRMRHYWSKVSYDKFAMLNLNGTLDPTDYKGNHNANFNAFNIDMILRWEFAPGSELALAWKNAVLTYNDSEITDKFFDNLRNTIESPGDNSFSIKLLYYLDYIYLKKKK